VSASLAVELCGLPGAGKTTVAQAARDRLAAAEVACDLADQDVSAAAAPRRRLRRRATSAWHESTTHPVRTSTAAAAVLASRQARPRDTVAVLAQWLAVRDLLAGCHRSPGVHLFEPARRTDLVVVLDLPAAEAAARLGGRLSQHSRVQGQDPDAMLDELVRGERLLHSLLAGCPVPVVHVGADVAPDVVAARVADVVLDAWQGGRRHIPQ
jgi:thymidylate kinase